MPKRLPSEQLSDRPKGTGKGGDRSTEESTRFLCQTIMTVFFVNPRDVAIALRNP
ncbi:MAG: hypothetical protein KME12_22885 [Trichocoleus desertorum ATA4-8-CV12]|nr:hypothetical protein [Trichocoleus desertorum ATA4-8-CV12]